MSEDPAPQPVSILPVKILVWGWTQPIPTWAGSCADQTSSRLSVVATIRQIVSTFACCRSHWSMWPWNC